MRKGKDRIELADVVAVVADASALALDGVIDATFAGETRDVETEFGKARGGGSSPAAIVSAAIRQVANLHKMKLSVEGGDSIEFAMMRGAPPVHFTRKKPVEAALRAWTPPRLLRAMAQLAEASLDMRRNCGAGRGDRATHAAVDCGERAKKRELRRAMLSSPRSEDPVLHYREAADLDSRLRGNERRRRATRALQIQLITMRHPAIGAARLLHIAQSRERHVEAGDKQFVGRHHIEDALAGSHRLLLVVVDVKMQVRPLQRHHVVPARVGPVEHPSCPRSRS